MKANIGLFYDIDCIRPEEKKIANYQNNSNNNKTSTEDELTIKMMNYVRK